MCGFIKRSTARFDRSLDWSFVRSISSRYFYPLRDRQNAFPCPTTMKNEKEKEIHAFCTLHIPEIRYPSPWKVSTSFSAYHIFYTHKLVKACYCLVLRAINATQFLHWEKWILFDSTRKKLVEKYWFIVLRNLVPTARIVAEGTWYIVQLLRIFIFEYSNEGPWLKLSLHRKASSRLLV